MSHQRASSNRQADPTKKTSHPYSAPNSGYIGILRLQSTIGNQAVQRVLDSKRHHAMIQRFAGPEHEEIGNATGQNVDLGNGVVLTWGQVVAIAGDEVGSVEELKELVKTDEGKGRLRAMLENAEVPGTSALTLPAPTKDQKDAQTGQFLKLLLDNKIHFTSGDEAINEWRRHHSRAIDLALKAGLNSSQSNPEHLNEAHLTEAFGQHFLTDMFSGGHVRTPRDQITSWYVSEFAPKVIDNLIANLKARLVDGIYPQIAMQDKGAQMFPGTAKDKIRAGLDDMLNEQIAKLGGKQEVITYFGKGVAGIISGVIHDTEGAKGVMVNSAAHPEPWQAMGDGKLNEGDPTNKEQAQLAVKASLDDVNRAYFIGQTEGAFRMSVPMPDKLPTKVFFKFNSDAILSAAQSDLEKAAAYLAYNQDNHLELVGHTDPIGTDDFNDGLGQRRAESVERFMADRNIMDAQVDATSRGKSQLATTNPRQYAQNRRVEFLWTSRPLPVGGSTDGDKIAYERASTQIFEQIGPPYNNVEGLLPAAVPGENPDLPDWKWGNLSPEFQEQFNQWVKNRFGKDLQDKLMTSDALKVQKVQGYDVNPRWLVGAMLSQLMSNPYAFVDSLFQEPKDP